MGKPPYFANNVIFYISFSYCPLVMWASAKVHDCLQNKTNIVVRHWQLGNRLHMMEMFETAGDWMDSYNC